MKHVQRQFSFTKTRIECKVSLKIMNQVSISLFMSEAGLPLFALFQDELEARKSGAPNEYFSENEPLTTENENLDAFKAFSSAFLCCWKEVICSSLPAG